MNITNLFKTENGKIIVSIIIGLGFATMFRQSCYRNSCYIIQGPKKNQLKYYYRIEDKCYKYNPYSINCPSYKENREYPLL